MVHSFAELGPCQNMYIKNELFFKKEKERKKDLTLGVTWLGPI